MPRGINLVLNAIVYPTHSRIVQYSITAGIGDLNRKHTLSSRIKVVVEGTNPESVRIYKCITSPNAAAVASITASLMVGWG